MPSPLLSLLAGLLSTLLLSAGVQGQATFDFNQLPAFNSTIYTRVFSTLASFVAPAVWELNQQQSQVAPLTSWLLWGTQPDVDITLNYAGNFTQIGGSSNGFSYLGSSDFQNDFGYAYGGSGCSHRNTFNRFYFMGNTTSNGAATAAVYNWASADGSTWLQVLDPATTAAWSNRIDFSFTGCVVTAQDVVVSLGAVDVWQSTNLGVTFTAVAATGAQYTPRQYFGSGIYSPVGGGADVIVVAAGRGYVTGANPYGGGDFNDVWTSTNLGASWTAQTTAAPWSARDAPNFGISANGVMVLHGGSFGGGYTGWAGDVWVSVNGGGAWTQMAANTKAGQFAQSSVIFDAAGYMYLILGQYAGYLWSSQGWKSTQTFANIVTWGTQVNSSLSFPSNFPLAVNSSFSTFTNGSYQTVAQQVQQQCSSPSTSLPTASAGAQFGYTQQPMATVYSRAASTIAPITVPLTYPVPYQGNNAIDWAVAPTGSWMLWGAQQDVSVSTNSGQSWTLISGVTYAGLPAPGITDYGYTYGADQCQHRGQFNRFYVIGNGSSGAVNQPFYVWASNNGWEWINVIDSGTMTAFANRPNVDFSACLVDIQDRVYSLGGNDIWVSTNLGVTFTPRNTNNMYTPRTYFGSGIFTNSSATGFNRGDVMVVMGGRVPPNDANPYGGADLNDVWLTTNGAYSWTLVSASAPWSARDSVNVAVSAFGVMVLYGGSIAGGYGGWLDDTWVSLDGGYLWTQLAGTGALNNRSQSSIFFDSLGYLNVWFGQTPPAYNWTTDGWRSTYSFNNIQQWGPLVNPAFSLTTLSPGYSACAAINYLNPFPANNTNGAASSSGANGGGGGGSSSSSSNSGSGLSHGAIAGIVIGSVVGAALIAVLLFVMCARMSRGNKKSSTSDGEQSTGTGRFANVENSQVASTNNNEVEMN